MASGEELQGRDIPYLPRLLRRWRDPEGNPGRLAVDHASVIALAGAIAPGSRRQDLGGTMSLNVRLDPAGLVLRVHQPFETARRLRGLQEVRRRLTSAGLLVAPPVPWQDRMLLRCAGRWAEIELYVQHEKPAPTHDAYVWLFGALGTLHRTLATLDLQISRPVVATFAPPASLRRWLPATEAAMAGESELNDAASRVRSLGNRLSRRWIPASRLPVQLVHGDVRLGNLARAAGGDTLFLDFGFAAHRARVYDVAYALAWAARALGAPEPPVGLEREAVEELIAAYEGSSGIRLGAVEREALPIYAASVPLYFAALAGYAADPVRQLREALPFLRLTEWLLEDEARWSQ